VRTRPPLATALLPLILNTERDPTGGSSHRRSIDFVREMRAHPGVGHVMSPSPISKLAAGGSESSWAGR
jgi:hypothetical protein